MPNPVVPQARDIVDRLDPALRHLVAARTDLSPGVLGAVRDSLNQRRAETAMTVDTVGLDIEQRDVPVAAGRAVTVRIYRGGPPPSRRSSTVTQGLSSTGTSTPITGNASSSPAGDAPR